MRPSGREHASPVRTSRRVVAYLLMSLDGVVEGPGDWVFASFDAEMNRLLSQVLDGQDAVPLGRATYEEWSKSWPGSSREPFATFINSTPKYIASATLVDPKWTGSAVTRDVESELNDLKARPGGEIGVHGSIRLVQWLLRRRLVDELKLAVFPVIAGRGRRLFEGDLDPQRLRLRSCEPTEKGVVLLTYDTSADAQI